MIQCQENPQRDGRTDGKTDGRMDKPYFIDPFWLQPGAQKRNSFWRMIDMITVWMLKLILKVVTLNDNSTSIIISLIKKTGLKWK